MSTTFYLKRKNGSEDGIIYFQFNHSKIKIKVTTGLKINLKDWGTGYPKKTNVTSEIRMLLNSYKDKMDRFLNEEIRKTGVYPNREVIKKQCQLISKGNLSKDEDLFIYNFMDLMVLEQSDPKSDKRLSANTMRCKKIHFEHFKSFIGRNKRMIALNQNLIDTYRKHLFNDPNDNVTKNNYLKSVKTFICWCKKKGFWNGEISIEKFPTVTKPVVTLTGDELEILENATLPKSERQQVDIFLLGCYTALSIGDLISINRDMIIGDELHLYREKTEYKHRIPLIPQALQILKKYDFKLPHIHPNKGSNVLKSAFVRLNLDRNIVVVNKVGHERPVVKSIPLHSVISWHKARKTAITLALADGVNPIAVQQLSGHRDHRSFSRYIDKDILLKNELTQKFRKASKSDS